MQDVKCDFPPHVCDAYLARRWQAGRQRSRDALSQWIRYWMRLNSLSQARSFGRSVGRPLARSHCRRLPDHVSLRPLFLGTTKQPPMQHDLCEPVDRRGPEGATNGLKRRQPISLCIPPHFSWVLTDATNHRGHPVLRKNCHRYC